jgi:hypothetical protein
LITMPGPGSSPPEPVNIEVDLSKGREPVPVIPDLSALKPAGEETSALPPPSGPNGEGGNAAATLAAVNPEGPPDATVEPETTPAKIESSDKPAERPKPKSKVQVKATKRAPLAVRQAPHKKTLFARGLGTRPLFGGSPVRSKAQGPAWGALFNAPPSAADGQR